MDMKTKDIKGLASKKRYQKEGWKTEEERRGLIGR
jgi:hypothetical protein